VCSVEIFFKTTVKYYYFYIASVVHFNFFAITIRSQGKRAIYSTIQIVSIFLHKPNKKNNKAFFSLNQVQNRTSQNFTIVAKRKTLELTHGYESR
jgi:hypothetical protein